MEKIRTSKRIRTSKKKVCPEMDKLSNFKLFIMK